MADEASGSGRDGAEQEEKQKSGREQSWQMRKLDGGGVAETIVILTVAVQRRCGRRRRNKLTATSLDFRCRVNFFLVKLFHV
ncbi:unnamed protein product [Eruca vesicaria subsp. sativa]|uniref:Uncharacterized protein n=1 Tax=Eruca vesicaria subsp. sativa TaxID=29727 RepID=A0ABC8JD43_ERUVS|nr:unnamed protein product [Eruca vesicaria subsp. sativa]